MAAQLRDDVDELAIVVVGLETADIPPDHVRLDHVQARAKLCVVQPSLGGEVDDEGHGRAYVIGPSESAKSTEGIGAILIHDALVDRSRVGNVAQLGLNA